MCIFSIFGLNEDLQGFENNEKIAWFQTVPFLLQFKEIPGKLLGNQNMSEKIVFQYLFIDFGESIEYTDWT